MRFLQADLALRDRLGRTPLHRVCDAPEFARVVAEYLICSGADPAARDVLGGADTGPDQLAY